MTYLEGIVVIVSHNRRGEMRYSCYSPHSRFASTLCTHTRTHPFRDPLPLHLISKWVATTTAESQGTQRSPSARVDCSYATMSN